MEHLKERHKGSANIGRLIIGILILFLGASLLTKNLNWFPSHIFHYLFSWQMILIVIGAVGLLFRRNVTVSLILICVGLFFMLGQHFPFPFEARRLVFPAILITLGLIILFKRSHFKERDISKDREGSQGDYIDDAAIFGGGKMNIFTDSFRGGRITSIFGGGEYNLTQSKLSDGVNVIDVLHIFGGSKIIVPGDWKIRVDVVTIFGGFSDKRMNVSQSSEGKELHIRGLAIFGGGEITSML